MTINKEDYFEFMTPESCADYIMNQLYDGPHKNPYVIARVDAYSFVAYRIEKAMDLGLSYYEIAWNPDGKRILELIA